jgi:hypothetical protein
MSKQPTFTLRFRAMPDCPDAIKAVRRLLKIALRALKLRCVHAQEDHFETE